MRSEMKQHSVRAVRCVVHAVVHTVMHYYGISPGPGARSYLEYRAWLKNCART